MRGRAIRNEQTEDACGAARDGVERQTLRRRLGDGADRPRERFDRGRDDAPSEGEDQDRRKQRAGQPGDQAESEVAVQDRDPLTELGEDEKAEVREDERREAQPMPRIGDRRAHQRPAPAHLCSSAPQPDRSHESPGAHRKEHAEIDVPEHETLANR